MKYILILLATISFAFGQVPDCNKDFFAETEPFYTRSITVCDIMQYAKECYADTIKATLFESEYIVQFKGEGFSWILTEKQLEEKGYYYSYRWIINTVIDEDNPMEFEHIFIGKPTFEGFIKWINKQEFE